MTERTAEDWGRVAVGLPGWPYHQPESYKQEPRRSQRGIRWVRATLPHGEWVPDPADPATAGCMLAMLEAVGPNWCIHPTQGRYLNFAQEWGRDVVFAPTLGRACIAAAEALGRWPGGDQ